MPSTILQISEEEKKDEKKEDIEEAEELDVLKPLPTSDEKANEEAIQEKIVKVKRSSKKKSRWEVFCSQLNYARKRSIGVMDLIINFSSSFGGCAFIILLILGTMLPISMITLGVSYYGSCRAANIPLLLIIGGANALGHCVFITVLKLRKVPNDRKRLSARDAYFQIFHLVWFVAACVLTYIAHEYSNDIHNAMFCHSNVYYFLLWYVIASFLFHILYYSSEILYTLIGSIISCVQSLK